jgi:hypothetical protein
MTREKMHLVLPIITGIVLLLFPYCTQITEPVDSIQPFSETDSTAIGEITRNFSEQGRLISVETTNGAFYDTVSTNTNQIIDYSFDGTGSGSEGTYRPHQSKKDIYYMRNFTYKGQAEVFFEHCYVMLGYTKIGYFEAAIIPVNETIFELTQIGGHTLKKEFKGTIDFIYMRFSPKDVENLFHSLYHISVFKYLNETQIEELFQKALSIHDGYCWYISHTNDNVMLTYKIIDLKLILKNQSILYDEFSLNGEISAEILQRQPNGSLSNILMEMTFNKVQEKSLIAYYSDDSFIKDDPLSWLSYRTNAFDNICNYFKVDWKYGDITFYVFNNENEAGKYYVIPLGFSIPELNEIYTRYDQTYGHELTHVISYHINNGKRIQSILINEGLATWLSMRDINKCNYHRLTKAYMEMGKLDQWNLLNDGFRSCPIGYFIGASFVGFLIEKYGIDLFITFFAQEQYSELDSFQKYYYKNYKELYDEWKSYLTINDFGELTDYEKDIIDTYGKGLGKFSDE